MLTEARIFCKYFSLQGKQGIVKLIYRGIIFLYDQNQEENGGYFCCKSRICEKTKLSIETFNEKVGAPSYPLFKYYLLYAYVFIVNFSLIQGKESDSVGCEDFFSSSPKSPLSPEKPPQAREFNCDCMYSSHLKLSFVATVPSVCSSLICILNAVNQPGNDGTFSIGQALRIRVGPLKGYRCRVLAIRRSDVTVKLESKQKVLTGMSSLIPYRYYCTLIYDSMMFCCFYKLLYLEVNFLEYSTVQLKVSTFLRFKQEALLCLLGTLRNREPFIHIQ